MNRGLRFVASLIAVEAVAVSLLGPASVGASTSPTGPIALTPSLNVRRIDSTRFPDVKIDADAPGASATDKFAVTENGKAVVGLAQQTWTAAQRLVGTVLLIDTAAEMARGDTLAKAKLGANDYIAHKPPNEVVAVVAGGSAPRVVINFTADANQLSGAIDQLALEGEPSLLDAVRAAAHLFTDRPELLANVIVVSDGSDKLSKTTAGQALAALESSKAAVYTIGVSGAPDFNRSLFQDLATGGGQYVEVSDPTKLGSAISSVQTALRAGVELTYKSQSPVNTDLAVNVSSGGHKVELRTVAGGVSSGSNATPTVVHTTQAPAPLRNNAGLLLIALMVVMAAGLFAYAVLALVLREKSSLETALEPYQGGIRSESGEADVDTGFAQTAILSRAVAATGRFAEQQGVLSRVEAMLEQADSPLRPAEALFFYLVGAVLITIGAGALFSPILGIVALIIAGLVPPAVLSFLAGARLRKFHSQLPDTLQLLASSLRAGFSFLQGVEAVANESHNPMGKELGRVMIEAQLGRPVEEALQDCADRMKSPDFDWAVMAVRIQREVGGNLAELLQTVGETMVERERLRRDVKSLTAEGRISAIVLACLPPALGVIFYFSNPTYMNVLFNRLSGQIALLVAVVAAVIGFFWMKKIVDIEV